MNRHPPPKMLMSDDWADYVQSRLEDREACDVFGHRFLGEKRGGVWRFDCCFCDEWYITAGPLTSLEEAGLPHIFDAEAHEMSIEMWRELRKNGVNGVDYWSSF